MSPAEARRVACLLDEIIERVEPPPLPNCSCHISPPCNDCIDFGGLRETLDSVRALRSELEPQLS